MRSLLIVNGRTIVKINNAIENNNDKTMDNIIKYLFLIFITIIFYF